MQLSTPFNYRLTLKCSPKERGLKESAQDDKREAHADRKEKHRIREKHHRRKKGAADAGASRKNTGQRALPRVFLIRRILQLMHERRSARNVGFFEDVHYMRLYRVARNEELI